MSTQPPPDDDEETEFDCSIADPDDMEIVTDQLQPTRREREPPPPPKKETDDEQSV